MVTNRTLRLLHGAGVQLGDIGISRERWLQKRDTAFVPMPDGRPARAICVAHQKASEIGQLDFVALPMGPNFSFPEDGAACVVDERDGLPVVIGPFSEHRLGDAHDAVAMLRDMRLDEGRWDIGTARNSHREGDGLRRVHYGDDVDFELDWFGGDGQIKAIETQEMLGGLAALVIAQSPQVAEAMAHREEAGDGDVGIEARFRAWDTKAVISVDHEIYQTLVVHEEVIDNPAQALIDLARHDPDWRYRFDFGSEPVVHGWYKDRTLGTADLNVPEDIMDAAIEAAHPLWQDILAEAASYEGSLDADIHVVMTDGEPVVRGVGEHTDSATVTSSWSVDTDTLAITTIEMCDRMLEPEERTVTHAPVRTAPRRAPRRSNAPSR